MNCKNTLFSKIFWITLLFKQNNYHKYGVLLHTLKVMYGAVKDKNYKFIVPALLHDIGKPFVAYQKDTDIPLGIYSFTNHEEKSYQLIKNYSFISQWTKDIVRYHFIIIDMQRCKVNNIDKYNKLNKIWNTLDDNFIKDLKKFLKYDDFGKN